MASLSFKSMKFTTKLFSAVVLLCLLSIVIISGNAVWMSQNGLNTLGRNALEQIHGSVYNSLLTYNQTIGRKLESDLKIFDKELQTWGSPMLDTANTTPTTIVNQVTQQSEKVDLPRLLAGANPISGSDEIVDSVTASTGSVATIFQLIDNRLLRISTTVKKPGGERATGTYIPADSPVYKTIVQGQVYKGKAFVVNDWYLTAYAPLRDSDDTIVGALFVGQIMLAPEIQSYISGTKLNDGYFFAYTETGDFVIHPTFGKDDNLFKIVPAFADHKEGFIEYEHGGEDKVAFVKYIKEWGMYLAINISHAGIDNGLAAKMIRNNLLVGLVVVIAAVLITILLVRTINRPLQDLAAKSVKVGEGDYTITFEAVTDDAIGQLARSLGVMVTKAREMLEDIIHSSQALAAASTELASISEQMVSNADATARIADTASGNARDVSDNMTSISAAMEQSATNLDMIASASEEMGTTIREIAENSSRARATTEDAVEKARKSHDGVRELGEAARAIGTVTETITDISDQTNLLALNATIEAARAGEAGKGFAVVANEIKELAKQTAAATGKIREAIEDIQNQTGETVKDIESITVVIQDVNDVVNSIVSAVEEQSITTAEIVNNVSQASQGITEINENIASSSAMTAQMSDGVGQVKERSVEVMSNSQYVRSSADELSQLSEKLTALVSRFRI
ncbi:MAG: methyl-accepting chemotaxis protein [Desulfobulbaceae bacterium]|nr:MAG: methyl-accepting chemotaxis protein [Desulfobulbaceae bacterium]